jgi:hypothetical protein
LIIQQFQGALGKRSSDFDSWLLFPNETTTFGGSLKAVDEQRNCC